MVLLLIVLMLVLPSQMVEATEEHIVETPFHIRARVHDSQSATVQFEIAEEKDQRTCQMYKFTIRRNQEHPHSMPEQNLTFWRNSLDLKHLAAGNYTICATICSEKLRQYKYYHERYDKNRTAPITACVHFQAFRSHYLILTLYILVIIILTFSQIMFSLRKRKFQARIKVALIEVESTLQKWRTAQTSTDHPQSYTILQSLVNLPASPAIEHSVSSPTEHTDDEQQPSHPIHFHLEPSDDHHEPLTSL